MSEELLAVLRKIVSQCPESMLKAVGGGYVIKDIALSLNDVRVIDTHVKLERGQGHGH
jgi:hypothetical protein